MRKHATRCLIYGAIALAGAVSLAQVSSNPFMPYQQPKSYSDYYKENLQSYARPPASAKQYTVDKYFYHNPTISPYLNLTRSADAYTNNYFRYVKPELDRRATSGAATMSPPRPVAPTGGQYYNHWYGGRAAMGLSP
jgi:hypothetical protein